SVSFGLAAGPRERSDTPEACAVRFSQFDLSLLQNETSSAPLTRIPGCDSFVSRFRAHPGPRKGLSPPQSVSATITLMLPARGPQAIAERLHVKTASFTAEPRTAQEPGQRPPQLSQVR